MTSPVVILAFCILTSIQSTRPHPNAIVFTLAYLAAGLAWAAAVWVEFRKGGSFPVWLILAVGLAMRLVVLPFGPLFDNDVYRYLWDGHVAAHGINPFLYPPASEHLAGFRFAYLSQVSYPDIGTIYPPFAQMLFLAAAKLHLNTPALFKLTLIPFDLATAALIIGTLKKTGKTTGLVIAYAWSPLVLKEVYNSAHVDVVMGLFVVLAIYYLAVGRPVSAGIAAALSVMTKGVSLVLLPILAARRSAKFAAAALVALVVLWTPYASAGGNIFHGLSAYGRFWRFNDGAFYVLYRLEQGFRSVEYPQAPYAKAAARLLLIAYLALSVRRLNGTTESLIIACRNVAMALLLLMPVVDPWYALWFVPLLCIAPNRGMLALCALCPLSYLYYAGNSFPGWLRVVEYSPVYLLLMWDAVSVRHGVRKVVSRLGVSYLEQSCHPEPVEGRRGCAVDRAISNSGQLPHEDSCPKQ